MRVSAKMLARFSTAVVALAFCGMANAQNQQPGRVPESVTTTGTARGATFEGPFADPGNLQAKELATREGISVGEATRRLRMMHKAGQLARRLEQQAPETFAGMEVDDSPAGIRFKAHFVGGASEANRSRLAAAGPDPEIAGNTDVADASLSISAVKQLGNSLLQQTLQAGVNTDFGIDPFSGRVTFLAKDPAALRRAIANGVVRAPQDHQIEQSEGIIPTTALIAGAAYNAQYGNYAKCTMGFSILSNSTTRGASTAGHCDIHSPAQYNATFGSNYGDAGGVTLTFRQEWVTNNLDFQWHTVASPHTIEPQFWEGSSAVTVTGAAQSFAGETLCKFGRTTGKTCGTVDSQWWYDSPYGYFLKLNNASVIEGDSGGPVFSGSIAKGWIHGRDGSGNGYFMPVTELYNKVPSMQVLCIC